MSVTPGVILSSPQPESACAGEKTGRKAAASSLRCAWRSIITTLTMRRESLRTPDSLKFRTAVLRILQQPACLRHRRGQNDPRTDADLAQPARAGGAALEDGYLILKRGAPQPK